MQTLASFRSFGRPIQVCLLNLLLTNVGFYMIVPFMAGYLAGDLGMELWLVGLILGVRTLSQQGLSLVGGSLADWVGYKPAIVVGCLLRVVSFAMLGLVDSAAGLIVATALIGLGGALFMPAVRGYLAHGAGPRRVQANALLEMTQHVGSLVGPLIGSLLIAVDFRLISFGAAAIFVAVGLLQFRYLPDGEAMPTPTRQPILQSWGVPLRNRPFVLFCLSLLGLFFLYNQVYLGLPLEIRRVTQSDGGVGLLFTMLAIIGIVGQVPVVQWAERRLKPPRAIGLGVVLMAVAFVPLLLAADLTPVRAETVQAGLASVGLAGTLDGGPVGPVGPVGPGALAVWLAYGLSLLPLALCCLLLSLGQMLAVPFVSGVIPALAGNRLLATYFGMYALVQGVGAALGNLAGGAALGVAATSGWAGLPWALMVLVGLLCAASLTAIERAGWLQPAQPRPVGSATPTMPAGAAPRHT
ncbi:MAG: MFS transporter [Chloroflexi bacterium]|nr:MFS transporter [Chloroflexota bacterium]